jgi:hypothetical protein
MPRTYFGKLFVTSVSLLGVACLDANPGGNESTASANTDASTGGETDATGGSTVGGIMTTTEEPESDSSSETGTTTDEESTSTTTGTTEMIPAGCGNGVLDEGEECDNGNANADDAACTSACNEAFCGDGLQQALKEACDDGVNDGAYGGCLNDCSARAPYCGDGIVDAVESCDDDSAEFGCLMDQCEYAKSCLELKTAWGPFAPTGTYQIRPLPDFNLSVHCDMDTDDGGYTYVKFGGALRNATEAEAKCAAIGMQLFVPRTKAHLEAAVTVAKNEQIVPKEGEAPAKAAEYLRIFGIYPVMEGMSCKDKPLVKAECIEWEASDKGAWWVSEAVLGVGQPGANNCEKCSMNYTWNNIGTLLTAYEVINNGGEGAVATHFMCDVGDKQGVE